MRGGGEPSAAVSPHGSGERSISVLQYSDLVRLGVVQQQQASEQQGGGILQKIFPFFYKQTAPRSQPQISQIGEEEDFPTPTRDRRLLRNETLPRNYRSQQSRSYD